MPFHPSDPKSKTMRTNLDPIPVCENITSPAAGSHVSSHVTKEYAIGLANDKTVIGRMDPDVSPILLRKGKG